MTATPSAAEPITVSQHEAARLSGLSSKTLDRRTQEGEPTGRRKVGRRVVFVRQQLAAWLASQTVSTAAI